VGNPIHVWQLDEMVCGAGQEAGGLVSRGETLKETLRDYNHVIWEDRIIQFDGDGFLNLSLQPFNLDPSLRCPIREPARQRDSFEDSESFFIGIPARIFDFP